ncbi:hypothetical protein [Halorarius halobius]|uniref:hypothetical protein n=1 Tax=Halorarius halobius TaxID=2962671 RepID=UPI0020CC03FC|nr:hypothetical protein [Halorarius halobius]
MPAPEPADPEAPDPTADPEAVAAALRRWGDRHRERELDRALARLEAAGDLTEVQRAVVADLSRALTDDLLAPPLAAVDDSEAAAAYVATLFDLEEA